MFYYLEGTVTITGPSLAVIDVGGAGYLCATSQNTLKDLVIGQKARLYTQVVIREDAFDIYGFTAQEELNCFRMLIGINGVGPKAALSILSSSSPSQLAMAVLTGDEKLLTAAPGIGKKIAQRIILELKDKLAKSQLEAAGYDAPPAGTASSAAEAETALAVLGYDRREIAAALKGIDASVLTTEEVVRLALKKLARI